MRLLPVLSLILSTSIASANPFAAAGRIENPESGGTCSAALVQPDVIVTAAHCVTGIETQKLNFRLGDGKQSPTYPTTSVVVHPLYEAFSEQRFRRLRFDIALIRLSRPVPDQAATPFRLAEVAEEGEGLFLASWRAGEGSRPRQRRCLVIKGEVPGVVTLGCRVQGGESGAPVLRLTSDGMELVAIINSQARQGRQPVAYAADVRLRIVPLLERLETSP